MLSYLEIINKIDQLEEAHILITAFRLRVFSIIDRKSISARELSGIAGTQLEGTEALLNALSSIGALVKRNNKFKNTPVTFKNFCESSHDFKKGTVMLKQENLEEYKQLTHIIKKGRNLQSFGNEDNPKFRRLFTYAMHERSELYSSELASFVTRKPVGKLLDLGCGPGSYSAAILMKDKKGVATLIDRSAAIRVARKIYKDHSIARRFKFVAGDLFQDDFGNGFNTVLLSNILHIYNPKENMRLFNKISNSLEKGGRFVLYDLFLNDKQTEPYHAALFALTMLLFTKTGKSYTFSETESLLKSAGFKSFKRFKVGVDSSIIEAVKK